MGTGTSDDAGVFRLTDELALVQTVDFFTPVVDDPYQFGLIAASNALSDVYAMGGRPLCAMNIVTFPAETMPIDVLRETLRGGLDKLKEAGVALVGGGADRTTVESTAPQPALRLTGGSPATRVADLAADLLDIRGDHVFRRERHAPAGADEEDGKAEVRHGFQELRHPGGDAAGDIGIGALEDQADVAGHAVLIAGYAGNLSKKLANGLFPIPTIAKGSGQVLVGPIMPP